MATLVDVAIVGAGLSGLQAALDLHAEGRSFVVLEARDRVGGKTNSVARRDGKGRQELGAAWLNDTNQSMVWRYVEKFGLTPVAQNHDGLVAFEDEQGNCSFYPYGSVPKLSPPEQEDITSFRDKIERISLDPTTFEQPKRTSIDNLTLEAWCQHEGAGKRAMQTVASWCRGTLGQEPSELSALAFLEMARGGYGIVKLRHDGKDGAQQFRLREGTQSIAENMALLLPKGSIRLSAVVTKVVSVSAKMHQVHLASGQLIEARKVILTLPSPAYETITFEPSLPATRQTYLSTTRYGIYYKFICLFKTPWWRERGYCGLVQSFKGPMNHCRDVSVDQDDNFALACFVCGHPARPWQALNEQDRKEAIVRQLAALFQTSHEAVSGQLIDTMTSAWGQDQWAGWGCPWAAPPPGTLGLYDDGELIDANVTGKYFVGTEMTNIWRGYMDGALRSGQRGARRVLQDLGKDTTEL